MRQVNQRKGRCIATAKVLHPYLSGCSSAIRYENGSGQRPFSHSTFKVSMIDWPTDPDFAATVT